MQCDKQSSFPCAGDQYRRSESAAACGCPEMQRTVPPSVLTELKRGLQDILIACVDGLEGLPDAIDSVFRNIRISKSWRAHWEKPQYALQLSAGYPQDHLPSTITNARFPTDDSVRKVIYLAIKDASKWSMPIQNWRLAMSHVLLSSSVTA